MITFTFTQLPLRDGSQMAIIPLGTGVVVVVVVDVVVAAAAVVVIRKKWKM